MSTSPGSTRLWRGCRHCPLDESRAGLDRAPRSARWSQNPAAAGLFYIASGRESGADILAGGDSPAGDGFFVNPTVFVNTRPDMKIVREEIFRDRCWWQAL